MLTSCAPVNINFGEKKNTINTSQQEISNEDFKKKEVLPKEKTPLNTYQNFINVNGPLKENITILLSKQDDPETVKQFINIIELAVYKKKLKNISFEINIYDDIDDLNLFLSNSNLLGKTFIGPLSSEDTKILSDYCNQGGVFFSFSSNKELAKDCVYLVNFFPENELRIMFEYFPKDSKIALLYPENTYGFEINKIIDTVANKSNSIIINRASYNEDLSNAPEAIKELGKYELRKYELNRQKKILATKKDNESKKRLIRLEKFKTIQDLDFTHVIIADYGLRLLQVAPLLPYYDIDPNIVKFVGTGAWDDKVFYDEPSLKGSIYPGIEFINRKKLVDDYFNLYDDKLLRTSTLPFDLVGLLSFVISNNYNLLSFYELLNESNIKFSGVDGSFYFINNAIERDLSILKIDDGRASKILK